MDQMRFNTVDEEDAAMFIREQYNMAVERESFVKPNGKVVTDIYYKFLDDLCPRWRKSDPDTIYDSMFPCPPLWASACSYLNFIIASYKNNFEVNFSDLFTPVKKRTLEILAYLIQAKLKVDKYHELKAERVAENQEKQAIFLDLKQKLSQRRLDIEKLTIQLSNCKPTEQLQQEHDELYAQFEVKVALNDGILAKAHDIKEEIKTKRANLEKFNEVTQRNSDELQNLETMLQRLEAGKGLKNKIDELDKCFRDDEQKLIKTNKENQLIVEKNRFLEDASSHNTHDHIESFTNDLYCVLKSAREKKNSLDVDGLLQTQAELCAQREIHEAEINQIEHSFTLSKLQFKMKLDEERRLLEEVRSSDAKKKRDADEIVSKMVADRALIMKKIAELDAERVRDVSRCNDYMEKMDSEYEALVKKRQEFLASNSEKILIAKNALEKINSILGTAP